VTRTSPPQVAFSSGELDPLLHRRFDYQRFQTGLAKCQGFLPLAQGGVTRAPGTIYRGATRANAAGILVPFQFAADDALTLEFTPGFMRVWRYGQLVMAGASPYELATPYDAVALQSLRWVQSADVIYLCDGIRPIHRLARFALDSWTLTPWVLDTGPFRVQNLDKARTVQASAKTGSITLLASTALFSAGHVGSLVRLEPTDFTTVPLFTTNEAVTVGDFRRYGDNIYQLTARSGADVGQNPPVHTEGEALTANTVKWLFVSDGVGIVRITAVASPTSATATVLKAVPEACVASPTYRWAEGAWSAIHGYPSALELYDQRLVAAANISEPRTAWFSAIGDFSDWGDASGAVDGPFSYIIAGEGSINRIINLRRGKNGLHIFALGEEHSTRSDTRAQVIGPTTAVFGLDGSVGSSPAKPIAPGGDPIFISRDKRRVMQINYSLQSDANQVRPLSRIAQHFGARGFEQIVWQSSPEPMAWLRMGDGTLAAMIYDAPEEVLGWAGLPVAGGFVESFAVAPDPTGAIDIVTMIVRRQINGATVRMVEEMSPIFGVLTGEEPISEACHFFAASEFTPASPTASFTVPHLVGQSVEVWTEAGEFGPIVVPPGGTITLPAAVSRAVVGLFDDTHFLETLDVQAAAPDGNSMGRKKRLYSGIGLAVHRTAQGLLAVVERSLGQPETVRDYSRIIPRVVASPLSAAFSGVVKIETPSGQAEEVCVRVKPFSGAPLTITGIAPTVQEAGR
jgi:hypothetical protein